MTLLWHSSELQVTVVAELLRPIMRKLFDQEINNLALEVQGIDKVF